MYEENTHEMHFNLKKTFPKWAPLISVLLLAGITYGVQRTALSLYAGTLSKQELFSSGSHWIDFLIFIQIASTISSYGLFKGITGFFSGIVSSKYKRKNTMRLGLLLLVVGSITLAFGQYLWVLILGNAFIGGGLGFLFTSSMSALTDISGTHGSAFSVGSMEFSVYFGSSLGSYLAGIVADKTSGFAESFVFALIIAAVALFIGILLIRKVETKELVEGTAEEILFDATKVETRWSFKDALKTPTLVLSYVGGHFSRICDSLLVLILPIMLSSVNNFSPSGVGLVTSAFTLAWSLSMPFTGKFSDRHGRKITLIVGFAMEGIALILLTRTADLTFSVLLALLAGFGTAIYYPALPSITRDVVPIIKREKSLGVYRASLDSGYFTGPLIISGLVFAGVNIDFLADSEVGNMLRFPFIVLGSALILISLLVLILATETRPGWIQASYSLKHAIKVKEVFKKLELAFEAYVEGKSIEEIVQLKSEAKELEHQADKLVFQVTQALYGNVRPAPDDYQFYKISSILDGSIGHLLRSLRKLIVIRRDKLPKGFMEYLHREAKLLDNLIDKAVEVLELVCIQPMASHPIFDEVHQIENALDKNNHAVLDQIVKEKTELNTVEQLFLIQIIEALEIAANEVEDAVDVMKVLGVKYQISRR